MKTKGLSVVRKKRYKRKILNAIKTHIIRRTPRILKSFVEKAKIHRKRDNRVKYQNAKSLFVVTINKAVRRLANISYSKFRLFYRKYCETNNLIMLNTPVLSHIIRNNSESFQKYILFPSLEIFKQKNII